MKLVGITETGDPCFVNNWTSRLLEANIIISKELSDELIGKLVLYSGKIIFHHTITGQGGTRLEPGVNPYFTEYNQFLQLLSEGFPEDHYVLRLDPIILINDDSLKNIESVLKLYDDFCKVNQRRIRCRVSMLDMYNHVIERFDKEGIEVPYGTFHAPNEYFRVAEELFKKYPNLDYESCVETKFDKSIVKSVGCVSRKDLEILGKNLDEYGLPESPQRRTCLCLAKKQILGIRPSRCPHNCIYCYWKY